MKFRINIMKILFMVIALLFHPQISMAEVTEKDVVVITRIIGLLENGPRGMVEIGLIDGDPGTKTDIATFRVLAETAPSVGGIRLKPVEIKYDDLATTNVKVIFIPDGISKTHIKKIFEIAKIKKIITISTSVQCLIMQECAISVTSSPAVDVKISVAAAAATNVSFSSTFRMIIKEVQ
jgi:hypothetical protein